MSQFDDALENFRTFLRFRTISAEGVTNGSYAACTAWLKAYLDSCPFLCNVKCLDCLDAKPIVFATWVGSDPTLNPILLNSHYDVVPVMPDHWNHEAFEATLLDDGHIVGRGTQDMKSVCIQYIEALKGLHLEGFTPKRTVVLTFVPDEETGGTGFQAFLTSPEYAQVSPLAFGLDEGLANPSDCYTVFYGERTPWWLLVKATGPTGHGSRFVADTAMEKLVSVCNQALAFRQEQQDALNLSSGCSHAEFHKKKLGDVTTLNLTMLKGGVSLDGETYMLNVIPNEAQAGFDVRISPHMHPREFKALIDGWCRAEGVTWSFAETPLTEHYITSIDRQTNPWWGHFIDAAASLELNLEPEIFPAATDSRFLRQLGIPALGFSPMKNTPILLHDHNEMLHKDVFLNGIEVYMGLLRHLLMAELVPGEIPRDIPL